MLQRVWKLQRSIVGESFQHVGQGQQQALQYYKDRMMALTYSHLPGVKVHYNTGMAETGLQKVLVDSQRHYIQGKYNDAIKLLSRALKEKDSLEPKDVAAVNCNLASCYLKLGLLRKVVSSCDAAIKEDAASLQAYLYKGKALHRLKKSEQARQVWKEALTRYGDFQVLSEILDCMEHLDEEEEDKSKRSSSSTQAQQSTKQKVNSNPTVSENAPNNPKAEAPVEKETEKTTGGFLDPKSVEYQVARGFLLVNESNYDGAIKLFNTIIPLHPKAYKSYVGRGTAHAMTRQLLKADADFTQALTLEPNEAEIWKRRGQVRAALGQENQAVEDLNQAQSLCKDVDVDIQKEIGLIYQARGDNVSALMHFKRAEKILLGKPRQQEDVDHKLQGKTLWNAMGLCQNSLGYCMEAVASQQHALDLDPEFRESVVNMAQAYKDYGNFEKADELFLRALQMEPSCVRTLNLHGQCLYGAGEISRSYATYTKVLDIAPLNEDCLFMHGLSAHGLGLFRKAVESYSRLNTINPAHWAYYTRELALFQHHHLDMPMKDYNADIELNECFKEAWTKRLDPAHLTFDYCKQADFSTDIADVDQNVTLSKAAKEIAKVAFPLGDKLQYRTPGFLENRKQHRWFGLAMLDMAQTVQRVWRVMRKEDTSGSIMVTGRASSGCRTSHVFGWRDLFDVGVKWRQASEPNDPVWWVDLLNQQTFAEGYGSQTPMILGQCHVVRYYPYWKKAFVLMKDLMRDQCNPSPAQLDQIKEAKTPHDLYAIRSHDFYVATPCRSQAAPGRIMEGTRLTIQKKTAYGYTCSIRTPGTPSRWKQFDQEMAHAWEQLCDEAVKPSPDSRTMFELSATLAYYWYNFMPLSRGSAACGLLSLHALLLAVDLQIGAPMPYGLQVDWEAIFLPTPKDFIRVLDGWIGSSLQPVNHNPLQSLPYVSETFSTLRSILEVLNYEQSLE